ncbi:unnamed protein product [Eruca vesicaria subsp. sativa]|uniref:Uncharacterized protein n=1 Tax=Eruca vesicaria subsp. sativa TaxID=29727 RepID=A0ABC8ILX1_ERUVS|nr:unnamed protein product [Eruca vesicaria subsp. sativa]
MINLRIPILVSFMFFLVFIAASLLFAKPVFAARVGRSLVQEEVTKISQYNKLEEPEIPGEPEEPEIPGEPEEPEIPEEPEEPEDPDEPEEPEIPEEPELPEEPEEPPKESEERSFEFPSWIPSFPFPGANGGFPKTEKTKPTATTSVSKEASSGSSKKP